MPTDLVPPEGIDLAQMNSNLLTFMGQNLIVSLIVIIAATWLFIKIVRLFRTFHILG